VLLFFDKNPSYASERNFILPTLELQYNIKGSVIGPMPWDNGIVDVHDLIVLAEHLFEEVLIIE
jgi:hypothetical protein